MGFDDFRIHRHNNNIQQISIHNKDKWIESKAERLLKFSPLQLCTIEYIPEKHTLVLVYYLDTHVIETELQRNHVVAGDVLITCLALKMTLRPIENAYRYT